jgi:hypothetical protein
MNNLNQLPIYIDHTILPDELTEEPLAEYIKFIKDFHKKPYTIRSPIILIRITRHISSRHNSPRPIIYFMNETKIDYIFGLELEDNFWTITMCNEYGEPTNRVLLLSFGTSYDEILDELKKMAISNVKNSNDIHRVEN